jgi:hypothetical protein
VKSALERGLDPRGHRWEHTALEQDREQQILDWIKQNREGRTQHASYEKRTQGILQELIQFQVPITRGWINSLVLRCPDEIIQAKFPQEEQRLQVRRMFLERTMQNLNEYEYVQGRTAELQICI